MANLPRPNKELGQHFLTDRKIIESIVTDYKSGYDTILEIGPGPAVLSRDLSSNNIPYYAIEMDDRFIEDLKELTPSENIYNEDALKFNWDAFISSHPDISKIWLVSNLPYNISSRLLTSFISVPNIDKMTLMFQKEVGEKTFQRDKKNTMSSLFALTNTFFKTRLVCKVLPGAFSPPPKVDSVVASYERIENPSIDLSDLLKFEKYLRCLFKQKRKQIKVNLKVAYGNHLEALAESNIEPTLRAETLSLEQVQTLYKNLTK